MIISSTPATHLVTVTVAAVLFTISCQGVDSGRTDNGDDDSSVDTGSDTGSAEGELICEPGEIWCFQGWISECNADGMGWTQLEDCEALGLVCAAGECTDISEQCAQAINERSYIGCEYWAVTLANTVDSSFSFGLAIANDGNEEAHLEITDGLFYDDSYSVPPGEMIVIETLDWNLYIKEPWDEVDEFTVWITRQVANAAYRIVSDRPITAYQFSPLHYSNVFGFSYTNDASLLLPVHVYRDEYLVVSRQPLLMTDCEGTPYGANPGLLAVIGVDDEPTEIRITTSAHTAASDEMAPAPIPALEPGDVYETTLGKFEVLQLISGIEEGCTDETAGASNYCFCNPPPTYDLTGTHIEVLSGPSPAVFGGHLCSFVPFDKIACDHMEQQMFPLDTWGRRYLCAHTITQVPTHPTVWRVMSGVDANPITFFPDSIHDPISLDKGEFIEIETKDDFEVEGEGRLAVAQYMVGHAYDINWNTGVGDPAMSLAVPVEQYRLEYTFLAPESYMYNYLTVVHKTSYFPELDGFAITGDTVEINNEWSRTNLEIEAGSHHIECEEPFGITVYGVGEYTSYLYPGGLDLKTITAPLE